MRNMPRAKKDRSGSASRKGGIEDQKIRIPQHCKGAPPESSKSLKGCATPQPGVILSEAKNLSVTVLAMRKTTERFFASLRMTASGAGAHRTSMVRAFINAPTLKIIKNEPSQIQNEGWATRPGPPT